MASDMRIVHIRNVESVKVEGGGRSRRMISRKRVGADKISLGVSIYDLGEGHTWHSHPQGEEAAFYVVRGTGTLSWGKKGEVVSKQVREGGAVFTPSGVRHQIINTGSEPLVLVWSISPPKE